MAIPATDQDRSAAFFIDQLGFEKRMDAELAEGFRWIEVAPPGSDVSVAIVAASAELPAGIDTGIRFVATDAEAEHASMQQQGVDVGLGDQNPASRSVGVPRATSPASSNGVNRSATSATASRARAEVSPR